MIVFRALPGHGVVTGNEKDSWNNVHEFMFPLNTVWDCAVAMKCNDWADKIPVIDRAGVLERSAEQGQRKRFTTLRGAKTP